MVAASEIPLKKEGQEKHYQDTGNSQWKRKLQITNLEHSLSSADILKAQRFAETAFQFHNICEKGANKSQVHESSKSEDFFVKIRYYILYISIRFSETLSGYDEYPLPDPTRTLFFLPEPELDFSF